MLKRKFLISKLFSVSLSWFSIGLLIALTGCAGAVGPGGSSNIGTQSLGFTRAWTEQVQLHDGSVITAHRTYVLGGRSEPGSREGSSTFQTVVFGTPIGDLEWTTDFRDSQPEPNSLSLIAFDIVDGVPYIATRPAGCIAYNKWQRPNPPQLLFKHVNRQWIRIGFEEFPREITQANVVLGRPSTEVLKSHYTVEEVQKENINVRRPEYRFILREPIIYDSSCIPMVTNGRGLWLAEGWFKRKPTFEACVAGCMSENFDDNTCPCKHIFKRE